MKERGEQKVGIERQREAEGKKRGTVVIDACSRQQSEKGRGLLSREVFTLLLLMAKECNGRVRRGVRNR